MEFLSRCAGTLPQTFRWEVFFEYVTSFDVPCQKLLSRKQNQGKPPVQPDIMFALQSLYSCVFILMQSRPEHVGVLQIRQRKLK
jgi:hypothetical protein